MSIYIKENPKFLKQAIDSVLKQTLLPEQIVMVKDGPLTTELDDLINGYSETYSNLFTIVTLEKNMGLGFALAEGVKKCRNPLIARMDTDDICAEKRFEIQQHAFLTNPKLDIIGSYIAEFDRSITDIISYRKVPVGYENILKYAKARNPFNHMTVMYKKEAVIKAGNYTTFHGFEDYYLWVRMLVNGATAENIPESLVYARTGIGMFERRGGFKYALTEINLQKKLLQAKFITTDEFMKNCMLRVATRLVPNSIRKVIYLKIIRKV